MTYNVYVPNALNVRLDSLTPEQREALVRAIEDVALELKRSGKHPRVSVNFSVIQLLFEALEARGVVVENVIPQEKQAPKAPARRSGRESKAA